MLNNKEPFLFFASIPPYTKLVPFGIMESNYQIDSNYQIPKKSKKRQQILKLWPGECLGEVRTPRVSWIYSAQTWYHQKLQEKIQTKPLCMGWYWIYAVGNLGITNNYRSCPKLNKKIGVCGGIGQNNFKQIKKQQTLGVYIGFQRLKFSKKH